MKKYLIACLLSIIAGETILLLIYYAPFTRSPKIEQKLDDTGMSESQLLLQAYAKFEGLEGDIKLLIAYGAQVTKGLEGELKKSGYWEKQLQADQDFEKEIYEGIKIFQRLTSNVGNIFLAQYGDYPATLRMSAMATAEMINWYVDYIRAQFFPDSWDEVKRGLLVK